MSARYRHPARAARTGGFTLVELLVTITIIAILAGIALGALVSARQIAFESKTKATIAKLDQIVTRRYESYRTRRVPIDVGGLQPKEAARVRLRALRELMRMEMPERLQDVYYPGEVILVPPANDADPLDPPDPADVDNPVVIDVTLRDGSSDTRQLYRPALARLYFMRYVRLPPNNLYNSSELLYMIVTMGRSEDREKFSETEMGDADDDGLMEFHDGWGNPIAFLRWAAGFSYRTDLGFSGASEIQSGDPIQDHDPFDSRNLESDAYRLIPLIYSPGPDGIYDINREAGYQFQGDPYLHASGEPNNAGQPIDGDNVSVTATEAANGSIDHHDNIHNHHLEQR